MEETMQLKKPLLVNGQDFRELKFDFDELTAFDMDRAGKLLKDDGSYVNIMELDAGYHYKIFSVAVAKRNTDITVYDMMRLGARDYADAAKLVRSFFFGSSEALSRESTSEE